MLQALLPEYSPGDRRYDFRRQGGIQISAGIGTALPCPRQVHTYDVQGRLQQSNTQSLYFGNMPHVYRYKVRQNKYDKKMD